MSQQEDLCNCTVIHEDIVQLASKAMLSTEVTHDLAEIFRIFGDATRIKILHALKTHEMCVCDLAACLNMTHSAISHQLRLLKAANLVRPRKQGKVVYYTLSDSHVTTILNIGLEHILE